MGSGPPDQAGLGPFYNPQPVALRPVPPEFDTLAQYLDLLANTILAEFWACAQQVGGGAR